MKYLLLFLLSVSGFGAQMSKSDAEAIADAIYHIEGGPAAKVPYGILSVKVKNEQDARRVCLNTIRNNYTRWQKQTNQTNYFLFLADRYCPKSADPVGNRNWRKNILAKVPKSVIERINNSKKNQNQQP